MSENFNEKEYFAKWDGRILSIVSILAFGLTAFAVLLNVYTEKECKVSEYVYCGEDKSHSSGH